MVRGDAFGWGLSSQGVGGVARFGGFVILGVSSPKPPAEGRLRPPVPLQMGGLTGLGWTLACCCLREVLI